MKIKKVTPIYAVDKIEPNLAFWTDKLGYKLTIQVPRENKELGFVALENGSSEVMLQTLSSWADDCSAVAKLIKKNSIILYVEVDSILQAQKDLADLEVLIPLRETFYGAKEVFVRNKDGQIFGFSEPKK